VYHLAAVVSGQAEVEFDLGMRVNVDATRALLDACRRLEKPPRFVFSSSLAVFGGPLPAVVPDDAAVVPQSSYGSEKAIRGRPCLPPADSGDPSRCAQRRRIIVREQPGS
jgi:nucleoside-diphosphate-sugar epimerase